MDTISKLNAAVLSVPNELTVAAANFNLDFSLMKVEAPKEFHGVRDALSSYRRDKAEEGQPHITARKLGALFEALVPPIPNLIQAYGIRASAISSRSGVETKNSSIGLFAAQAGIDGTNIWAAATSGRGALAVHLLACMLARIWKSHEAISLWVELVDRRKQEISDTYNNGNATEIAAIMASQQTFSRQQLAHWDNSARSWLQTADVDRRLQQTQLMLIINNVQVPVNLVADPYKSVISAWTSAMCAMELLVQGIPQQVQDGAVLLAMSSWHLYPNMEVLVDEIKPVNLNDELMKGGLITISAHRAGSNKEGVFWSLPLSRMRYYSPPVMAERHLSSATSRITMAEFWIVVLGIVLSQWHAICPDTEKCCRFIISLSGCVNKPFTSVLWLKCLADAAVQYTNAKTADRRQAEKLLGLGMRRCKSFLNDPGRDPPSFFGLSPFPILLNMASGVEEQIKIMRTISQTLQVSGQDLLIRYTKKTTTHRQMRVGGRLRYFLATALPQSETPRGDYEPLAKRQCHGTASRHCRWIVSDFDWSETACDGFDCSCVSKDGPKCACAESGFACSLSCHMDLESLSRCTSESHSKPRKRCEGDSECHGDCSDCYLRSYVSKLESSGEHCCFLQRNDFRYIDDWHFMLESPTKDSPTYYNYLLGEPDGVSIFKRDKSCITSYLPDALGPLASLDEIEDVLNNHSLDVKKLRLHFEDWWSGEVGDSPLENIEQLCSFRALVFANELYESLEGSTINIEAMNVPLYTAAWARWAFHPYLPQDGESLLSSPPPIPVAGSPERTLSSSYTNIQSGETSQGDENLRDIEASVAYPFLPGGSPCGGQQNDPTDRLAASFACIAMFETGEFNINPNSLQGVMALSAGDSIYVASDLISDPSENTNAHPVRRVFGNIGPEFLAPDRSYALQWALRGQLFWHFEDNFSGTSLHLSFTDFEMPFDVGVRGLRDTLAVLVESLVSVNDRGMHVGDLDIISMLRSEYLTLMRECSHQIGMAAQSDLEGLISIDSWAEFFDLPTSTGIVRAHGNWQARLAIATASIQRKKRTLVLPQNPCLQCIRSRGDITNFDIIVA
ncbi:hypothetical protein NUW58_g4875 [Xylaria curta]|uniref:Uncharacterized protein n=1 Tax=Xylaria curta TaxID=42375 RepID=A0ACC1P4F9_9PEZI|nr:hypothetical protein NUW58_g4875 [Xylaria curta]